MKSLLLECFFIAIALAGFGDASVLRLRRDVSELTTPRSNYLPPPMKLILPSAPDATHESAAPEPAPKTVAEVLPGAVLKTARAVIPEAPVAASLQTLSNISEPQESTILGNNGYEYQTVRRIKYRYRTRRDVSHLPTASAAAASVSSQYLPPVEQQQQHHHARLANEYLPPTESPAPETTTELQPVQVKEVPQETAIFAEDGYHYKQPEAAVDLKMARTETYLPPVIQEAEILVVEGPMESAVLADDGYHYRAVKRLRF